MRRLYLARRASAASSSESVSEPLHTPGGSLSESESLMSNRRLTQRLNLEAFGAVLPFRFVRVWKLRRGAAEI